MRRRLLIASLSLTTILLASFLISSSAWAQSLSLNMGGAGTPGGAGGAAAGGSLTSRIVQLLGVVTILSLAPSILMLATSFTRIVIVLSLLRSALGVQQVPPNSVMIGLALFLTGFIMAPTFQEAYEKGIQPLTAEKIDEMTALKNVAAPFERFMLKHVREHDLMLFTDLAKAGPFATPEEIPLYILTPAFVISELRRGFEIGFLLFLPFLIIDMVVASILMAMGMMMLPPSTISLPFKIIFFVLVDGWYLIAGSLVQSYGT